MVVALEAAAGAAAAAVDDCFWRGVESANDGDDCWSRGHADSLDCDCCYISADKSSDSSGESFVGRSDYCGLDPLAACLSMIASYP